MEKTTNSKFTGIHRLLHWSLALLMLVLFSTGFLRMEWMSKKNIINTINQHTHEVISASETKAIAKQILAPMWEWHVIAAYLIVFVFLIRIIYMLKKGIRFPNPFTKHSTVSSRIQGFTYLLFYIFLLISAITGLYLNLGGGEWKAPMEKIHKLAIYWFPIFIFLHFAGIIIGELTTKKGIVSKMIGG